jgi:hypothetical protein
MTPDTLLSPTLVGTVMIWVKVSYPVEGTPCVLNRGGLTNYLEGFTSRLQQPELEIKP